MGQVGQPLLVFSLILVKYSFVLSSMNCAYLDCYSFSWLVYELQPKPLAWWQHVKLMYASECEL